MLTHESLIYIISWLLSLFTTNLSSLQTRSGMHLTVQDREQALLKDSTHIYSAFTVCDRKTKVVPKGIA